MRDISFITDFIYDDYIKMLVDFLDYSKNKYSERTLRTYKKHLERLIGGQQKITFNTASINDQIQQLHRKGYKDGTIANFLCAVKSFQDFLDEEKKITIYLNLPFDKYKKGPVQGIFIAKDDYSSIIDDIYRQSRRSERDDYYILLLRNLLLVQLLIETGIKTGEVRNLKVSDFDAKLQTLTIKEGNRPDRILNIKRGTFLLMENYLKVRQSGVDYIFLADEIKGIANSPVTSRTIQRIVDFHTNGKYKPKDFRYTFLLLNLIRGKGIYETSDLLGGISDDTKTHIREALTKFKLDYEITEGDYNAYEYLRHKHGKTGLWKLIVKGRLEFDSVEKYGKE